MVKCGWAICFPVLFIRFSLSSHTITYIRMVVGVSSWFGFDNANGLKENQCFQDNKTELSTFFIQFTEIMLFSKNNVISKWNLRLALTNSQSSIFISAFISAWSAVEYYSLARVIAHGNFFIFLSWTLTTQRAGKFKRNLASYCFAAVAIMILFGLVALQCFVLLRPRATTFLSH